MNRTMAVAFLILIVGHVGVATAPSGNPLRKYNRLEKFPNGSESTVEPLGLRSRESFSLDIPFYRTH
jgi:hypothetical protein